MSFGYHGFSVIRVSIVCLQTALSVESLWVSVCSLRHKIYHYLQICTFKCFKKLRHNKIFWLLVKQKNKNWTKFQVGIFAWVFSSFLEVRLQQIRNNPSFFWYLPRCFQHSPICWLRMLNNCRFSPLLLVSSECRFKSPSTVTMSALSRAMDIAGVSATPMLGVVGDVVQGASLRSTDDVLPAKCLNSPATSVAHTQYQIT